MYDEARACRKACVYERTLVYESGWGAALGCGDLEHGIYFVAEGEMSKERAIRRAGGEVAWHFCKWQMGGEEQERCEKPAPGCNWVCSLGKGHEGMHIGISFRSATGKAWKDGDVHVQVVSPPPLGWGRK